MFNWLLLPAVAMALGWGLRGYIGGGPLGAMIPGAMVALALCLLLKRDAATTAVVTALAAVGVGFASRRVRPKDTFGGGFEGAFGRYSNSLVSRCEIT